ncbi:MAG: HEAT repeat domain-containing protein [Planctomycetes bacterium]|nr:HEAT repeat domain-containing protein [Planctomycetota bacterium]
MKVSRRFRWAGAGLCCFAAAGDIRADLLILQSGITEGEILEESEFYIKMKTGLGVVEVPRSSIKSIERGKGLMDLFREKWMALDPKSAKERIELALWCKRQGLDREAEAEFQKVLELDPDHAVARRHLGYEKFGGKWLPLEEAKAARGLVKYGGRWMAPEERDRLQSNSDRVVTSQKVEEIFSRMRRAKAFERDALLQQLLEVQSPQAGHYVLKHLNEESPALREAAIVALGRLKEKSAVSALARRAMEDPEKEVRRQAGAALGQIGGNEGLSALVPFLLDKDKIKRIRAARALGEMGDPRAIPSLIQALYVKVRTVSETDPFLKDEDEESPKVKVTEGGQVITTAGPQVQKVPGGQTINLTTKESKGELTYETNASALEALKKITGQDFDYDKDQWRAWWDKHRDDLLDDK